MKAVVIALEPKERKAIQGIVDRLKEGKVMMREGADTVQREEKKLWDALNGMYPLTKGIDKSYEYENYEIRYFEPTTEIERIKALKEKAIKDNDWEMASAFRDQEKKLKELEEKK